MEGQNRGSMVDRVHGGFKKPKIIGEQDGVVVEFVSNEPSSDMLGNGFWELSNGNLSKIRDQGESDVLYRV